MQASGPRDEPSPALTAARELRAKALVLLRRRYDEVRAAVLYVGRAEPDIERVVPSLLTLRLHGVKRGSGRRRRWRRRFRAEAARIAGGCQVHAGGAV